MTNSLWRKIIHCWGTCNYHNYIQLRPRFDSWQALLKHQGEEMQILRQKWMFLHAPWEHFSMLTFCSKRHSVNAQDEWCRLRQHPLITSRGSDIFCYHQRSPKQSSDDAWAISSQPWDLFSTVNMNAQFTYALPCVKHKNVNKFLHKMKNWYPFSIKWHSGIW